MIVGTAGHIDHGKTALVRALTGTDTDRLPEEKKRGITIELGYAYMPTLAGAPIGFVDVPGHEKLVRTMVAGASGIDYALLLVAADDGVMPQTVEHLTILSLLGVKRGAAIVTKVDRVDETTRQARQAEVRQLLSVAGLGEWPVLCVSALQGDGVPQLRELLLAEARDTAAQPGAAASTDGFRMGLDRVFTLAGIGTVVAGSIAAGSVRVGDSLCLAHAPQTAYRVRSLQTHGQAVDAASAGQRCAIGLVGLERQHVERGQMLCDPAIAQHSLRLDAWLRVAPGEPAPLRSGTRVHLHLATQEQLASVAVLGQASIAPGEWGPVQLVLQQPVHAWHGDRLVLRDASASRTVAGGSVLDTEPPVRYRQTPERLALLQAQRTGGAAARLEAVLAQSAFGIQGPDWLRAAGWTAWPFDLHALAGVAAEDSGSWVNWVIDRARLAQCENAVVDALQAFHAGQPQDVGPDLRRARRLALPRMPEGLWPRLVNRMAAEGKLVLRNGFVHLPAHAEQLRAADQVVAERALPLLMQGKFEPPWVRDIAADAHLPEAQVRQVLARLAKTGDAYQVVKDLYYHPHAVAQLAALARGIAGASSAAGTQNGEVSAAAFRDATGLGRKRAIQVLEFFDRIGFLRRVGDAHLLRPGTPLFPD